MNNQVSLHAQMLKLGLEAVHWSGLTTVTRPVTQGLGVIFCMHSVRPAEMRSFAPTANLEITPAFLDAALTMLTRNNYEFVSMDEVAVRIGDGLRRPKPFAAFTLDDGYRDNLEHALPVFAKHNCPFAVYVATGLVDGTTEYWWRALETIISQVDEVEFALGNEHFNLKIATPRQKLAAWPRLVERLDAMPEYEMRKCIRAAAARYDVDVKRLCGDSFMTWDEVRKMAEHPLATIGAHTVNHHVLSRIPPGDVTLEINQGKVRIENVLQKPVRHFAYPYGNRAHAGKREFDLAAAAGFTTSVTTRLGSVFPAHKHHMQALPRVMVSGRYQKARWLQALATGLPGLVRNAGKRVSVED
jgi:peptidoglycan/xylan/chitin deacetylase (PgdA/CDA1 family)